MFKILVVLLILHNGMPLPVSFESGTRYDTMAECEGDRLTSSVHLTLGFMEYLDDEGFDYLPAAETRCEPVDRPV
jgi:hypothetical protein